MSRVLVDTSVWVELFRKGRSRPVELLGQLLKDGLVCVNGLVRAEVLSGADSRTRYGELEDLFSAVPVLADPPDLWDRVGHARFLLARRGYQAAVADLVVAVSADHHDKDLFTLDKGFQRLREVVPFRLLELSPRRAVC
jgi:predicted nucleic acid-binding protein